MMKCKARATPEQKEKAKHNQQQDHRRDIRHEPSPMEDWQRQRNQEKWGPMWDNDRR